MFLETLYFREASRELGSIDQYRLGLDVQGSAETNSQAVGSIGDFVPLKANHPSAGLIDGAALEIRPAIGKAYRRNEPVSSGFQKPLRAKFWESTLSPPQLCLTAL